MKRNTNNKQSQGVYCHKTAISVSIR